jgi:Concanavalin A-like lectin/glucanases superfamily
MSASLLVFVPIALFVLVSSLCFVGCTFDTSGLGLPPFTTYTDTDVVGNPAAVAYWPLSEAVGAATAVDLVGTKKGTPHNGTYKDVTTAPAFFPCPGPFAVAPTVHSAFAPGTLTLGTMGIVPGDTVQPLNDPNVRTTAMQVEGGFVSVPANSVVNPAAPFTIEAWVRPEWDAAAPPAFRVIVDSRDVSGTASFGFALWINEVNQWEAAIGVNGSPQFVRVTGEKATLSATTHVVLTFDGTNGALFTDGIRTSPMTPLPGGMAFSPNTTKPLVIGVGLPWLPPRMQPTDDLFFPLLPFKGTIQNVAIYNAVLSDQVIMLHRDHGNGVATPTPP